MIQNGKDTKLNENSGTVPNMQGALINWFQKMTFTTIVSTIVNFQVVETPTDVSFLGVWQPFTPQQLQMMPENERAWKWFTCHAETGLILKPDDVITYLTEQFRVMKKSDYKLYGYVEYHLVQDYTGSGPA